MSTFLNMLDSMNEDFALENDSAEGGSSKGQKGFFGKIHDALEKAWNWILEKIPPLKKAVEAFKNRAKKEPASGDKKMALTEKLMNAISSKAISLCNDALNTEDDNFNEKLTDLRQAIADADKKINEIANSKFSVAGCVKAIALLAKMNMYAVKFRVLLKKAKKNAENGDEKAKKSIPILSTIAAWFRGGMASVKAGIDAPKEEATPAPAPESFINAARIAANDGNLVAAVESMISLIQGGNYVNPQIAAIESMTGAELDEAVESIFLDAEVELMNLA